ncbi:MAG: SDR family NAD(P)-dependent oxidoreductase, partial [Candidatus Heimdallarchaeota archaeon]
MVTGATSGIGKVTAQVLAQQGATVIVVGRNPEKGATTVSQIKQQTGNPAVEFIVADLSSQQEIHQLVEKFKSRYQRLDVLVNNAGALFRKRQENADGIEMTFALNHLGY